MTSIKRWMQKKKKKQNAGESLVETLIAIVIVSFASVMLAGAIFSSTINVDKSRTYLDSYYQSNEADEGVIKQKSGGTESVVTIKDKSGVLQTKTYPIVYFKNETDSERHLVVAYHLK